MKLISVPNPGPDEEPKAQKLARFFCESGGFHYDDALQARETEPNMTVLSRSEPNSGACVRIHWNDHGKGVLSVIVAGDIYPEELRIIVGANGIFQLGARLTRDHRGIWYRVEF